MVRALSPEPGASTVFRGRTLKVWRARPVASQEETDEEGEAGSVAVASKNGLAVWAGDGAVHLEEVQPEGRRRMTGAEFVRGHRPEPGERLA